VLVLTTFFLMGVGSLSSQTQNVGIGTSTPDGSALLELFSTSKGLLITRVTTAQRDAIVLPATALLIYNTDINEYEYNVGTPTSPIWRRLVSITRTSTDSDFWTIRGNSNIDPTSNFLGTITDQPLLVRTNNTLRLTVATTGEVITENQVRINSGGISLLGAASPIELNASSGAANDVLVSSGTGATPNWSNTLTFQGVTTTSLAVTGQASFSGPVTITGPSLLISSTTATTIDGRLTINDTTTITGPTTFTLLPSMPLDRGNILVGNDQNIAAPVAPGTENSVLTVRSGMPVWDDSLSTLTLNNTMMNGTTVITGTLIMPLKKDNIFVGDVNDQARMVAPGGEGDILGIRNGTPTWYSLANVVDSAAWLVGGNPAPVSPILGNRATTGMVDLDIRAGNSTLLFLEGATNEINVRGVLNLDGPSIELRMNNVPGALGSVLVSQGPGTTPKWSGALIVNDSSVFINAPSFSTSTSTQTSIAGSLTVTGPALFTDSTAFRLLPTFPLKRGYMLVGSDQDIAVPLAPGFNSASLIIMGGEPTWVLPTDGPYWSLSGNTAIPGGSYLGTTDANDVRIATNATTRMIVAQGTGTITMTSLSGAPIPTPMVADDGVVVADASGTLTKRTTAVILAALGLFAGHYRNSGSSTEFTVVISLPVGAVLDPQASITVTPEASSSVSVTPFVIAGSRTATAFSISFPGGLQPGESINWLVKNP
jgi:hypothetical protein